MAKNRNVEVGGILLTDDWKLLPVDDRNWELCHRHANGDNAKSRAAGTVGQMRWHRCGRYYSYNTVGEAIAYVADVEMKRKATTTARSLDVAVAEWKATIRELEQTVVGAKGGV